MNRQKPARGLILACLMILPACKQAPLSPAPVVSINECQTVTRCKLPATAPTTNGDLNKALTAAKGAWANCAAVVDMIYECQQKRAAMPAPTSAPAP
ncbi:MULTISPECIES: Rz1-like lysis system protein LysC [unclassified Paraburkholderia]|uniref:Rz1-like lysis system protein LysC n=1 Tax=unclassified Paraburkholderia TaxID=2615204 RepID=UPI001C8524B1|nr:MULTISPECIES: Rz1-like lysis system protein LysC [unclassified Paraburkholderia]